jgi:hypothetical protein
MIDLERCKELFEKGDRSQILSCLDHCLMDDLPIPDWLARAFVAACDDVRTYKVKSWDDVFGRPLPKGRHLEDARRNYAIAFPLWRRVRALHNTGEPIDKGLFEKVGAEFDIGGTTASELYYELCRELTDVASGKFSRE